MILQSENPIRMVRELKGAPLSIVMVLSLVHQRVTQEYLERATGYTDKPVSQALAYLQEVGLADHSQAGWQLIKENAKQLPLAMQIDEENQSLSPQDQGGQRPSSNEGQFVEGEHVGRNNSDSLNYLSKEVVVELNNLNTTTTNLLNLTPEVGKIPNLEEIQKILDAAAKIFEHEIVGDVRDYADLKRLLAWITQAFQGCHEHGRLKIENPAGLVYWAFHQGKGRSPEKKYFEEWAQDRYLPEEFKRASGQWEYEDDDEDEEV